MTTKGKITKGAETSTKPKDAVKELDDLGCLPSIQVNIDGQTMVLPAKVFSTGNVGYFGSNKMVFGNKGQRFQVGVNVVAVKPKE